MATIGLDKLYYAKITEAENGEETYGKPTQLAKAMSADLSVELAEANVLISSAVQRNKTACGISTPSERRAFSARK